MYQKHWASSSPQGSPRWSRERGELIACLRGTAQSIEWPWKGARCSRRAFSCRLLALILTSWIWSACRLPADRQLKLTSWLSAPAARERACCVDDVTSLSTDESGAAHSLHLFIRFRVANESKSYCFPEEEYFYSAENAYWNCFHPPVTSLFGSPQRSLPAPKLSFFFPWIFNFSWIRVTT